MSRRCHHEEAVVAAAIDQHAGASTADVRRHLGECASCRELYHLVSSLREDRVEALAQVQVPSAGQVWWRAELRARQEASAAAARPITVVTGLAAASLAGLLASIAGVIAWWLQGWTAPVVVSALAAAVASRMAYLPTGLWVTTWLVALAFIIVTPVLLYVALREE
jgi:hypothetical protein